MSQIHLVKLWKTRLWVAFTECEQSMGGSRIPRRRGHPRDGGGVPTYDFAKITQKLHENENILGRGGGEGHQERPLEPPLQKACGGSIIPLISPPPHHPHF